MENIRIPLIGEDAPSFVSNSTMWELKFPQDFEWKWVVLFSHPWDFTPVCTTEFIWFQDLKQEFDDRNVSLLWYSVDWLHSHIAWIKNIQDKFWIKIEFPILADLSIAYKYGMLHPNANSNQTVRAVFIINPEWKIAALMYYPLSNWRNIKEILRLIDSLQMTAKHKKATPANWPENRLFKDKVIIPPASTLEMANLNSWQYENKDWYICTLDMPK